MWEVGMIKFVIFPGFCVMFLGANALNVTTGDPCTYEDGVQGVCVSLPECAPYVRLLKESNTTLQGINTVQERSCGFDGANARVCCPVERSEAGIMSQGINKKISQDDMDDFVEKFPEPPICGLKEVANPQRLRNKWSNDCMEEAFGNYKKKVVFGGTSVFDGLSRWMALLGYKNSALFWQCCGTIITIKHVLTAAHCIKSNLYIARVGEVDYSSTRRRINSSPVDHLIKKMIRHEQYSKHYNDIGVLVLQTEIEFNVVVTPICLPVRNVSYDRVEITDRRAGLIEGWGVTENGTPSSQLQFAYLKILNRSVCQNLYEKNNVTIDERVYCAGGNMTDACKGDSGGPLVWQYCIPGEDEEDGASYHYQRGIISYGPDCLKKQFAGIYTSIEYFMPWIEEKVLGKLAVID